MTEKSPSRSEGKYHIKREKPGDISRNTKKHGRKKTPSLLRRAGRKKTRQAAEARRTRKTAESDGNKSCG